MQVEMFSDVVCPWCYIGKRHLEQALESFPHADQVTVTYRSFQLDPTMEKMANGTMVDHLVKKYGVSPAEAAGMNERVTNVAAAAGLEYHLEKTHPANTIDAHRLLHFAAAHGKQQQLKERLLRAYFTEGQRVDDIEVLVACAAEVGLNADDVRTMLAGDEYRAEFDADVALARSFGVSGVPFFVIDRTYGISGAQPAAVIGATLEKAWLESNPLQMVATAEPAPDGDGCADGVCAV